MSPEEILAMNYRNQQAITDQNGAAMNEIAKAKFMERARQANLDQEHRNALDSIERQLSGQQTMQKERLGSEAAIAEANRKNQDVIAGEHNKTLERLDEGRDKRDEARWNARELSELSTQLRKAKGIDPHFDPNDTHDDKRRKLVEALVKNQDYQDALKANDGEATLSYHEKNLADLDGRVDALGKAERDRKLLSARSRPDIRNVVASDIYGSRNTTDKQRRLIDKKEAGGISRDEAIAGIPELSGLYRSALDTYALSNLPDSKEYQDRLKYYQAEAMNQLGYKNRLVNSDAGQSAILSRARASQAAPVMEAANTFGPMASMLGGRATSFPAMPDSFMRSAPGQAQDPVAAAAAAFARSKQNPGEARASEVVIPTPLNDPNVLADFEVKQPDWRNKINNDSSAVASLANTVKEYERDIAASQNKIYGMGVTWDANGEAKVRDVEGHPMLTGAFGSIASGPHPVSLAEQEKRKSAALKEKEKINHARAAIQRLQGALSKHSTAIVSGAPSVPGYSMSGDDVIGLPAHTFPSYAPDARQFGVGGGEVLGWNPLFRSRFGPAPSAVSVPPAFSGPPQGPSPSRPPVRQYIRGFNDTNLPEWLRDIPGAFSSGAVREAIRPRTPYPYDPDPARYQ